MKACQKQSHVCSSACLGHTLVAATKKYPIGRIKFGKKGIATCSEGTKHIILHISFCLNSHIAVVVQESALCAVWSAVRFADTCV